MEKIEGKKVYTYEGWDGGTRRYSGVHECQRDYTGAWIYPRYYVEFAPKQTPEKYQNNFLNDDLTDWELKPDYAGETIYNTETYESKRCETLELPEGYTVKERKTLWDDWIKGNWVTNKAKKAEAENKDKDAATKAEMLTDESKSLRSTREMVKMLISLLPEGTIDETNEDYKKFIELDESITKKRDSLIYKG